MTGSGQGAHGQSCKIGTENNTTQSLDIADCINEICPWSGDPVRADSLTEFGGHVVGFCNPGCRDKFERAVQHFKEAKSATV
ncbi:MAG: glutathione S-transferase [Bacteroidota bacterium]|nr:glutathione S-transferase [Bacteroidota bacterium]MDE2644319.1 glutathione S-transferase [Bacteroidota bacterium]MXW15294.1 glutathione S-transferase [Rhodothermaceae bacterium]MYC03971.1 glutathione S-transferase [Rhodothermaceae bacterium]MYI17137.1 glutathione S-transferase [Rhodothermaceae bacterium]